VGVGLRRRRAVHAGVAARSRSAVRRRRPPCTKRPSRRRRTGSRRLPAPAVAQLGAVSFLHRFGSALNAHFHFHVVLLDGVFSEGADGSVTFHEAAHLSAGDVRHLERTLQRRVLRLFLRRGRLDEHTVEDMLTWQASGGFSLDASVRIHGSDFAGRERLLRYCARPPFALERMRVERPGEGAGEHTATASHGDNGVRQVLYLPARPTRDGRTVLALTPLEFLAALSRLIPPPRVHRHRYHGVLAPSARLRERPSTSTATLSWRRATPTAAPS
jgi:hypothetical protein